MPSRRPVGQQDGIEEIDTIVEATIEQTVEAFGGFYGIILSQLQESLNQASFNLDFANLTGEGIDDAVQGVITAQTDFYQHQIDEINRVRRETGNLSFGNVEELIRTVNALNNDARLQLGGLISSGRATSRIQDARSLAERTGTDRQFTEDIARSQYGTQAYDAEVAAAQATPEALLGISDLDISNLQLATDSAIAVFRDAITAPARTIESIDAALAELQPSLRELYDSIREQIIGIDGEISDAEQIQLNRLGTFEDFTQRYTELGEDAKQQILNAEQALASYRAGSAFAANIEAFQTSINAAGITVAAINQAFADLQPTLRSEYERLRAEIIGTDGVIDASEQLILERQGLDTFENFTAPFVQLRDSAVTSVQTAETALVNYVESRQLHRECQRLSVKPIGSGIDGRRRE